MLQPRRPGTTIRQKERRMARPLAQVQPALREKLPCPGVGSERSALMQVSLGGKLLRGRWFPRCRIPFPVRRGRLVPDTQQMPVEYDQGDDGDMANGIVRFSHDWTPHLETAGS